VLEVAHVTVILVTNIGSKFRVAGYGVDFSGYEVVGNSLHGEDYLREVEL
jgi:hypothetical protein